MKPTSSTLPMRVDSTMLLNRKRVGEPIVIVKLNGVGNLAPFDYRGRDVRSYVFRFETAYGSHVLKVPVSLWMDNKAAIAHDLMDQRRAHPVVVLIETPVVPAPEMPQSQGGEAVNSSGSYPDIVGATPTPATNSPAEMAEAAPASDPNVVGQVVEGGASVASEESQAERPLHEQAFDIVASPQRIKPLAKALGVDEATLREAINHSNSRVELANAGWVRRKE